MPIEAFSKSKSGKDGLKSQCKKCDVKYDAKYYEANKDKIKIQNMEWRKNNKDKIKIHMAKYRSTHKEKRRKYEIEYLKLHKAERQKYETEYRKIHKDKITKYQVEYHKINKDKIKIRDAKYRNIHKSESAEYYKSHKNELNIKNAERNRNVRLEVLMHYSNGTMQCKECGERNVEFLEIDHINGGGNKHKKTEGIGSMYHYLRNNNFPEGYQILCSNCNIKKVKLSAKIRGEFGTKNQKEQYKSKFKLKLNVFSHYKTDDKIKCSCSNCNIDDIDVLCLDHKNGDGAEHRKKIGIGCGDAMYRWIKNNNYPDMFRLLCHNCNQSLDNYGYCPHDNQ